MLINHNSTSTCNAGPLGPSLTEMCSGPTFFVFMSILDSLFRRKEEISGTCERVKPIQQTDEIYDYIVLGGGAAGSVAAARLSENPEWKVLLIEAGPDEPVGAEVPGFMQPVMDSNISWDYRTSNESSACFSTNGSCGCSVAKTLGGSTVHNWMIYLRGSPADYNYWASLGNEGWTWQEVEPYFLKSENNHEIERVGRVHHATGGPLSVERFPYMHPMGYSFVEAGVEAGFESVEDLNGDTTTGFTITQSTSHRGVRYSNGKAFLRPARNRENLHISLDSRVTKVIVKNGRAVAVRYYKNEKYHEVFASREIIVSLGAIGSPHVLLLSGIGPRKHLESVGVEVAKDLPGVGENLQNHMSFTVDFTVDEKDVYDNNWAVAAEYLTFQTGAMAATGTLHALGAVASDATVPNLPDIQISGRSYILDCAPGEVGALRSAGKHSAPMYTSYLHPKSRGRISLASNNPLDNPIIWGNYLDKFEDVVGLLNGVELILKLAETNAMKAYNLTLSGPIEACSNYTFPSEAYWICAIRFNVEPTAHHVGSCKMGPATDPLAVVDPQFRVHGIEGLRVADASVMPRIPSANTAAPSTMIGERVADFIRKYPPPGHKHSSC